MQELRDMRSALFDIKFSNDTQRHDERPFYKCENSDCWARIGSGSGSNAVSSVFVNYTWCAKWNICGDEDEDNDDGDGESTIQTDVFVDGKSSQVKNIFKKWSQSMNTFLLSFSPPFRLPLLVFSPPHLSPSLHLSLSLYLSSLSLSLPI